MVMHVSSEFPCSFSTPLFSVRLRSLIALFASVDSHILFLLVLVLWTGGVPSGLRLLPGPAPPAQGEPREPGSTRWRPRSGQWQQPRPSRAPRRRRLRGRVLLQHPAARDSARRQRRREDRHRRGQQYSCCATTRCEVFGMQYYNCSCCVALYCACNYSTLPTINLCVHYDSFSMFLFQRNVFTDALDGWSCGAFC